MAADSYPKRPAVTFPIYYNTTADEFQPARAKTRAWRAARKAALAVEASPPASPPTPTSTVETTPLPLALTLPTTTTPTVASPKAKTWSALLQPKAAAKTAPPPEPSSEPGASKTAPPRPALPQPLIQSLGVVVLRIMHEPGFVAADPASHAAFRGIVNSGNICFMNTVVQLLVHTQPFYHMLRTVAQRARAHVGPKSPSPLLDALLQLVTDFNRTTTTLAIAPDHFYQAIAKHPRFKHLKWGQQEDAEEFMGHLLDGLHEEFVHAVASMERDEVVLLLQHLEGSVCDAMVPTLEVIRKEQYPEVVVPTSSASDGWKEVGAGQKVATKRTVEVKPSPITQLFGGSLRQVLDIPKHKEAQSITVDPFQHLQVEVLDPRATTVTECLQLLLEPEMVPFRLLSNVEVLARKQTFVDLVPRVFIVHLKRFQYAQNGNGVEKVRKTIEYRHHMEVPAQCLLALCRTAHPDPLRFKLVGVVYHHGNLAVVGHYTVDVPNPEAGWVSIDDTSVQAVLPDKVVLEHPDGFKTAYILVYERE